MSLMRAISSQTYDRFSPLGFATQFGTTLSMETEGTSGRQGRRIDDGLDSSSAMGTFSSARPGRSTDRRLARARGRTTRACRLPRSQP